MRTKKHSRFKLYLATTLIAFLIPTLFSVSFVFSNKQKYLDNIISYVNKVSPINIYIEDISLSFSLEIILDNVKLYSKGNDNEFASMDRAFLKFNPLRLLIKKDVFYMLSDVDVTKADFYPEFLDTSIFQSNTNANTDYREIIKNVTDILLDKNILVRNFNTKIEDKEGNTTQVSITSLNGNFRSYKYFLTYDLNLPDETIVNFSTEVNPDLSYLTCLINAKDSERELFKYDINATNNNDFVKLNLKNTEKKDLLNLNYDYNNKKLNFELLDANIDKNTVYKFVNIALDTPLIYSTIKPDDDNIKMISNAINRFDYLKINAYGDYEVNKDIYVDFDIRASDKLFNLYADAEITNNNLILSNLNVNTLDGNIILSGIVPLNDPVSSVLSLNINDISAGVNRLSASLSLTPIRVNDEELSSSFTISELSYENALKHPLKWVVRYMKKEKYIDMNLSANEYIEPFDVNISLDNTRPVLIDANGIIPQELFVVFLGGNPIDNLSSLNVKYSLSNASYTDGKGNVHVLNLSSRKIYTEEYLIRVGALAYSNKVEINDIFYRLSEDGGINANAVVEYDKNFNVKANGTVKTPIGDYSVNGFTLTATNGSRILYASTENSEIVANGSIKTNGDFELNISTPNELKVKDISFNADVSIDNYRNKPIYLYGDVKFNKNLSPVVALDTQFELSNTSIVFTNIIVDYGDNRVYGEGILSSSDGVNKFTALLKDADNTGVVALDASINQNNLFGNLTISDLPFNLTTAGGMYGIITAKATVIGLLNDPVVYLDKFNIKDFEILGDRYDVSLTGYYKTDELEIKDVLMSKTGSIGIVKSRTFKKTGEQLKIPYAYFSKDLHNMTIEVDKLFYLSTYSGTINYNMRSLADGSKEFRIQTTPITINKRKLPEFGTVVNYKKDYITFENNKSHGISGTISNKDGVSETALKYVYDNYNILNIDGNIKDTGKDQVDLLLTSDRLNVEIFEIFNVLFTEIQSAPTNFMVDNKPYTLYAKVHGPKDDIAINGRFLGHGKKVKIAYFSDVFDSTVVDFNFDGNMFNVNNLTFTYKGKKNLAITGEAEIFKNNINYMAFDLLSSDEQLGLLNGSLDLNVVKIRGPLHVDLQVGGNIAEPRIGGTLTLMKSDVQLSINPQNTYKEHVYGMASKIYWDFVIEAWQQVRVAHNLVGDVYLEDGSKMSVYSTLRDGLELEGIINFDRGSIYYLQNVYQIENGTLTFPDVNSYDPIIEATAFTYKKYYSPNTTVSADSLEYQNSGESVTLYMEMNARVSQLLTDSTGGVSPVRFYTIPSLGQYQVNQLAGIPQGTFGNRENQVYAENFNSINSANNMNNAQLQQLTMNYSDLILRSTVLRPVERWVRQFLGIDYINLSPTVVNNLLFVTNNNNLSASSVWDNTSVGIGKYISKYLYLKYDVTYRVNDASRPSELGRPVDAYYFDHQFGFEVSLLKNYRLANFVFEYKINPFNIKGTGQDFNIVTRWRF